MKITPLKFISYLFWCYICLYLVKIHLYISRYDTYIQITTNWINNAWITDIDGYSFGKYIHKVSYCFIIDVDSFNTPNVQLKGLVTIETYQKCAH